MTAEQRSFDPARQELARKVIDRIDDEHDVLRGANATHARIVTNGLRSAAESVIRLGIFPSRRVVNRRGEEKDEPYFKIPIPNPNDNRDYYLDRFGVLWKEGNAEDDGVLGRGRVPASDLEVISHGQIVLFELIQVVERVLPQESPLTREM